MLDYDVVIHFAKGYIGHPYWPEMARVIDIQKSSGMNRAKSAANRRKALEGYLTANGLTLADYENLEKLSKRPFYMNGKAIIIPSLHMTSFLVATCNAARAAMRPCDPEQVRARFQVSDFATAKKEQDGVWSRFVTVTAGTGAKLSNQRGLRENPYISNFDATGVIIFDEEFVDPQTLETALRWGGQYVGVGASRKMGWGRFDLIGFTPRK